MPIRPERHSILAHQLDTGLGSGNTGDDAMFLAAQACLRPEFELSTEIHSLKRSMVLPPEVRYLSVEDSAAIEESIREPLNVYGLSKLAGEHAIRDIGCDHLIVRSSWLFAPHSRNFVRTILDLSSQRSTLQVVADQTGRPTACGDLASMTLGLVDAGAKGTFHAANRGRCTWFEFAREIVAIADINCRVEPCKTNDQPRPAPRPRFSVLDLTETIRLIGKPRHWKAALRDCVDALVVAGRAALGGHEIAPTVEER